jgi:hypothetical protein
MLSRIEVLEALRGDWQGATRLYAGHQAEPEHASASWLRWVAAGGPGFHRIRYVWSFEDRIREGHLLLALDPTTGEASAGWMDAGLGLAHVMALRGQLDEHGLLKLDGQLRDSTGVVWRWRLEFDSPAPNALELRIYSTSVQGEEELAAAADYRRLPR